MNMLSYLEGGKISILKQCQWNGSVSVKFHSCSRETRLHILWAMCHTSNNSLRGCCFLFFWPTVFGSDLIRFLTVCVDMNDSICFLSVCLNWTVTQQSTQCSVHKAEQQELITETLCDERPACNISKHRREDVGCVLSGSDVPRWLYVWELKPYKESLALLRDIFSSVDYECRGRIAQCGHRTCGDGFIGRKGIFYPFVSYKSKTRVSIIL